MAFMNKRVLGVIGGLGPFATARFLELVTAMTQAKSEQEHINMIVYNFPAIPDRTGYILGSNLRSPLPGLLYAGRELARQNVACIAVPCVTAHYFYPQLSSAVGVPLIDGVRQTALHLKDNGVACAGIMATDGTLHAKLFETELASVGIRAVVPSEARQADVTHLIYHDMKAGHSPDMERFFGVAEALRSAGAQVVILGCTELSVLRRGHILGAGILDTMEVMARESILQCGRRLKKEYRCLITR